MNDDPRLPELDDRLLDAVSALVDDAADADERALVAASPEAQRWVEHLRALRDEVAGLATVAPPVEVREAAFAAALAAFDDLQPVASGTGAEAAAVVAAEVADGPAHEHRLHAAVSGATERITSLAEHRRRRSRWLLSAAAAVVVVAGVGIGIQANRQSDDEAADSAALVTEAPAAKEEAGDGAVGDAGAERSVPAPMAAEADAPAGAGPAGPAEATEAATEAADGVADDATAMEALPSTIGSIENPASVGVVIASEDELATFVAEAAATSRTTEAPDGTAAPAETEAPAATEAPADTEASGSTESGGAVVSCVGDTQVFVGAISFVGTQAIAVYDPSTDAAIAYDAIDCRVLANVRLD